MAGPVRTVGRGRKRSRVEIALSLMQCNAGSALIGVAFATASQYDSLYSVLVLEPKKSPWYDLVFWMLLQEP